MNKNLLILSLYLLISTFPQLSFGGDSSKYKTKNVVVIIMDGPRYTETWGDSTHQYIPHMANDMAQHGVIYTGFRNNGPTYTVSGHTAICTGIYEKLENTGTQYPKNPSMFQYYLKATGKSKKSAYLIASKDKLSVLSDCKDKDWRGQFRPYSDCGVNGLETGYRLDSETCERSLEIFNKDKPNLVLINFRQPDSWGHAGNWAKYLITLKESDAFIYKVFQYLQSNANYKDNTTIFVTNDHGRHLDGRKDGFISHGDNCEGCRKINCFAYGPDFKKGVITDVAREQIDIPVTIGELLGFKIENSKGKIMKELFIDC